MGPQPALKEPELQLSKTPKPGLDAHAVIGEKGRLVIPTAIREALGLKVGDVLDMHVQDHELRLSTRWNRMRRAQERARQYAKPGILASDELSAERREAAANE
jgi:AbrB family looped-hinge helix DNA binding protein